MVLGGGGIWGSGVTGAFLALGLLPALPLPIQILGVGPEVKRSPCPKGETDIGSWASLQAVLTC